MIGSGCCDIMKKAPAKLYKKQSGKIARFSGELAEESRLRLDRWLETGCNAFDSNDPVSKPLSFWTEQDILRYINDINIKISSLYGSVVVQ